MKDSYLIRWKPVSDRPKNASYVLVKRIDETGQLCCDPAVYEGDQFLYIYDREDLLVLDVHRILGWAYFPYDEHT